MDIKKDIIKAIKEKKDLLWFIEYFKSYKENGGSQKVACYYLNELRILFVETPKEDLILEILDIVTGFCQPKYKIWNTDLY